MHVVAFLADLMDRSRLTGTFADLIFTTDPAATGDADVVLIDIVRFGALVGAIRAVAPGARIVAFGPHVDTDALAQAIATVPTSRCPARSSSVIPRRPP